LLPDYYNSQTYQKELQVVQLTVTINPIASRKNHPAFSLAPESIHQGVYFTPNIV
jgi:hypothetical protein